MLVNAQKKTRALASRSDTIDIIHTIITVDQIDLTNKTILAVADLKIKSKVNNLSTLNIDLSDQFVIDSITNNNVLLPYFFVNENIAISTVTPLQQQDSIDLKIYYHGTPEKDATWGGFYFSGSYAFSMGVGFTSQPHSVGRSLFPCLDNFVERSSYEFFIHSDINNVGVCNGFLVDSTTANNEIIWHWRLEENIPSYLVSVAVAPYTWVKQNLVGINGNIPVEIACLPQDTTKVKNSFAQLQKSFTMLEKHFGPYRWNKVGYTLVPFGQGAMEHATNIHIGVAFIDGTLNYETLIAHELSHHWFGDLVTCDKAEEMWLNEGFASYCELLHQEFVYGKTKYLSDYKLLHYDVLSNAHISDEGYQALDKVDSIHTYGPTVYSKGSAMLHTLRTYMGDSLFFGGMKYFLNQYAFKDVNTVKLNQALNNYSGKNWNAFFQDWITQPGFANFTIDSSNSAPIGNDYSVNVYVRQRKHKNQNYFSKVPLSINFYNQDFSSVTRKIELNNQCGLFNFTVPFQPVFISIDDEHLLSDASTSETFTIKTNITRISTQAKARVHVKSITAGDSIFVRLEHHWVAPDRNRISLNGYILNNSRYWRVDGINLSKATGTLGFPFSVVSNNSYLDSTWIKGPENNIKLFYRENATKNWTPLNDSAVLGNVNDRVGNIFAKEIKSGDYAFAYYNPNSTDLLVTDAPNGPCPSPLGMESNLDNEKKYTVSPNPTNKIIKITGGTNLVHLQFFDSVGQIILDKKSVQLPAEISLEFLPGNYQLKINDLESNYFQTEQIIIQ